MSRAFRNCMIALLSAGGALLLAGAVLFLVGFGLEGWDVAALNNAHFEVRSYAAAGDIESVHIHYESARIRIESGESFSLTYPVRTNSRGDVLAEVTVTEEDGVLTVTEADPFPIWGISFGTGETPALVLTLPAKEYEEITASASAGSVAAEGIAAKALTLRADAGSAEAKGVRVSGAAAFTAALGDVTLRDVEAGSLSAAADVGRIEAEQVRAEREATFTAGLGNIDLREVEAGSLSAAADTGSIAADGVYAESAAFTANLGDIDLRAVDAASVQLANELGDIAATLAGTKEEYTIRVQTELGSSNVVDRDGGSRRLNAQTEMGSIRIEFLG